MTQHEKLDALRTRTPRMLRALYLMSILALSCFNDPVFDAQARAETVPNLLQYCSANIEDANYGTGRCVGYIEAVIDEFSEKQVMGGQKLFCFPSSVSNRDIIAAVRNFLDENKEQKHMPAHIAVEYALRMKFPCR